MSDRYRAAKSDVSLVGTMLAETPEGYSLFDIYPLAADSQVLVVWEKDPDITQIVAEPIRASTMSGLFGDPGFRRVIEGED